MSTPVPSSPFFHTPPLADADSLAILHLKRDSLIPVKLRSSADDGYKEGAVTNTRFGSFPHSTLIGLEWGSQVRASKVDTGARGRKMKGKEGKLEDQEGAAGLGTDETGTEVETQKERATSEDKMNRKRKSDEQTQEQPPSPLKKFRPDPNHRYSGQNGVQGGQQGQAGRTAAKVPIEAGSGFVHLLPPTPEAWTSSLDHRTQVVYTPDYSYILQRLRVRPGSRIIEAGAGSGSFTHAAARAIFHGDPGDHHVHQRDPHPPHHPHHRQPGKVYSFEYHEPRVHTLRQEIADHSLHGIVELTHRDVCNEGFRLSDNASAPSADAVFLDLPAPWQALKHLSRSLPNSPLNPDGPVHLCTFSPCIEQVMATVTALRKGGWVDIAMVEVQHKRIDVRRERVGLQEEGLRGVNSSPASVDEAIARLREVENKLSDFHKNKTANMTGVNREEVAQEKKAGSKAERLERIKRAAEERKLYREGNLVTRAEPEVKTHTSYLTFAILPQEWTDKDERKLQELYPVDNIHAK